ncbi:MAG: hypothetical protein AB7N76_32545 [Planctomycetota bacterium]
MPAKMTWIAFLLTVGAGAAFGQGKLKIELVDPPSRESRQIPTITGRPTPGEKAQAAPARGPGEVFLNVEDADLSTDVLPLIDQQVGVHVRYQGPARKVTLRLTQPLDWEEALKLVAQFTNTHLSRDRRGAWVLRSQYGGKVQESDDLDGQLDLPRRHQATTLRTSAPRPRPKIQIIVLGGGRSWIDTSPQGQRASLSSARTTSGNPAMGTPVRRAPLTPIQPRNYSRPMQPMPQRQLQPLPQRSNLQPMAPRVVPQPIQRRVLQPIQPRSIPQPRQRRIF